MLRKIRHATREGKLEPCLSGGPPLRVGSPNLVGRNPCGFDNLVDLVPSIAPASEEPGSREEIPADENICRARSTMRRLVQIQESRAPDSPYPCKFEVQCGQRVALIGMAVKQ